MTEVSVQNDEFIVRVQAQVMTRDDSSGGWVPMGGGGLSNVGLRKVTRKNGEDLLHNEYLIYGTRIADNSVVLDCLLKRDIRYVKANPKFHHWQTDEKRFGLTFERYDDAKAFDKGIKSAVADLVDDGDDEVFAILDLPISRSSSQSASTTSTTTSSPTPQSPTSNVSALDPYHGHNHHHVHRVTYVSSPHKANKKPATPQGDSPSKSDSYHQEVWVHDPNSFSSKSDQGLLDSQSEHEMKEYSYVIIAKTQKPHEYSYPTLESVHKPPFKRETTSNIKHQPSIQEHPPLPKKKDSHKKRTNHPLLGSSKFRCKHCHDNFTQEENGRGSCEEAPDGVEKCIECVTCVWCAKGLIYHCMSDPDGDYGHPCYCDPSDANNCKKWTALTILSLFVPCLWCYWPLTACHKCGVRCGCCGGRHKAV
uniref:Sprouty-related, EVH1 domain-containing protein 2-like isoform X2 n=1 Tax=Crassostrea virginica TaxID=6565 RepID=A0A8B8DU14_CRAVI|nr:sprouty-related, EVH1 domain-containing protein 2-like isoform X2 [Crassostrea virginica]